MESLYPPIYVFLAGINQGTGVNMMIFDLRLFSLVLCICCCLVKSGEMKEKKATIFHMCDADQDLLLTVKELEKCLKSDLSNYDKNPIARANPSTVIALMDTDKDGRVSLAEYLTVVDNVSKSKSNSGMIEVIDRYGEKKMVSADEMWDRINAGPQDLKMENDHMVKETEGKTTMDKLAKENPQVNNIVTMAKWGLHILVMNEIVSNTSKIGHVRSLPVGGHNNSINENSKKLEISRENIEMNGRFEVWLEVTLESPPIVDLNSNGRHVMSQSTCYELHIVRDVIAYVKPHFFMLGAWKLDEAKSNQGRERIETFTGIVSGKERKLTYYLDLLFKHTLDIFRLTASFFSRLFNIATLDL